MRKRKITLISLLLVFVLLFNFFSQQIVYAMPAVLVGYGLIAFAAALTAYGVIISDNAHIKALYSAFQEWCDDAGWTEYLQSAYHQNKMILMGVPLGVAALGVGLNTWIRTQFNKGYNSKDIFSGNDFIQETGKFKKYFPVTLENYRDFAVNVYSNGILISVKNDSSYETSHEIRLIVTIKGDSIYSYLNKSKLPAQIMIYCDDFGDRVGVIVVAGSTLSRNINKPFDSDENLIKPESEVYYYAGEAVDYPMDRNPEDREMNLPPPIGMPNVGVTDAGVVFNGTPDEFLEQIGENQDYIDKAFDNILNPSNSISKPIVNEADGTITWPNTGVDIPVNPPIVNPPVTVPETAEQGIGETNSILSGIAEYVENIFAAPTKTIDFSPLMAIQLTDRFPFCLPFDLRDMVKNFQAERKAPEFEIGWKVRDTEVKYKMEFNQFEKLAEITRWGTFLIYCLGLILVSRKLIGGE